MRVHKGKLIASEEEEQIKVFEWAAMSEFRYPELQLLFHIPNEGKRGRKAAGTLKALGVKKGVPDICLPVARAGYNALYIELKAMDGKVSPAQWEFLMSLYQHGNLAVTCYGGDEAIKTIMHYLHGERIIKVNETR